MTHSMGASGPDIGGPLTDWHRHINLCYANGDGSIAGVVTPFGQCPLLSTNRTTWAMLHVWTCQNPDGPFGNFSPTYLSRVEQGELRC
jgi:hypothetical protein